jgi:hypothetical protein
MALWDAEAYETARFAPGQPEGLKALKAATDFKRLTTEWARNKDHLIRYMEFRGW